jgi:TonB family protein
MNSLMRQGAVNVLLLGTLLGLTPFSSSAQEASKRKILDHVVPAYPALARNMALEGVVKVEALVAPDGSVKSVEIRGGHPVLAQAAVSTVRRWRWEPAAHESHETVEIKFTPPAD